MFKPSVAVCTLAVSVMALPAGQDRRLARGPESDATTHRVALIFGNQSYPGVPLKNPINDARAIGGALRQLGFDVDVSIDASFREMARAVDRFIDKVKAGDVALVYFSGHGIQIEGENYLLPVDFDAKDEADARYVSYSASRLHDRMNGAGASLKILVLDACRNNPYRISRSVSAGLAQMSASKGSFIGLATGPGSTADDNPNGSNGLFTAALLEALNQPGLNLEQVFYTVRQSVNRLSGGRQIPWSNSSVIGDFFFRPSPGITGTATGAPTAATAPPEDLARKEEIVFWESIRDSRNPRLFQEYLTRYGDSGRFSVVARVQIQQYSAVPATSGSAPVAASVSVPTNAVSAGAHAANPLPAIVGKNRDWPSYSGDKFGTKYSSLDQIDATTVNALRIAWRQSSLPTELRPAFPTATPASNYEHTPLMVGGLLYMSTSAGTVAALNPTNGQVVWFDVPPAAQRDTSVSPRGMSTRGIAYWSNGRGDDRIIATEGRFLVALNAKTGKRCSDFGDSGQVDLSTIYGRPIAGFLSSSSPVIVRDTVILGGVAVTVDDLMDDRARVAAQSALGKVIALDAKTGKLIWTFRAVPRAGEFGGDTWEKDSWRYSGESVGWSMISADEENGTIYVPFATAATHSSARPGNNLFAETLVCLDAKSGQRRWHFQIVHHGVWEYGFPSAPILANIVVNGRALKVVAQISKQAFVYVFDRTTGQPVWPIEERPVLQTDMPGERMSPTQPFPTKPPAFDQQGVSERDLVDFTPELHAEALRIVRQYRLGPLYTPPAQLGNGQKGTIVVPGIGGSWGGAAFDPPTGMLYVPSARLPSVISARPQQSPTNTPWTNQISPLPEGPQGLPDPFKPPYSLLVAIDLNRGDLAWAVPNGDGPRTLPALKGLKLPQLGTPGRPAPLVTNTFVFLGEGSDSHGGLPPGTGGKIFRAYDKQTGKVAWQMELPGGTSGAPMTYMAAGKQYIVVAVSWRDMQSELIALALP